MVTSPIPSQLEPNMEANMAPNMDPAVPFPWWPPPYPESWKPSNMEANMEPNMDPPRYLSHHGDFPHTLKAGNQHGTQHGLHGTFPMVTSPIPWKLETNMEANMEPNMYLPWNQHGTQHGPPWYLFHGDLPHTLKAGNQHGSQQNKTPLSVLREPSLAARLCMCGFGLQPLHVWLWFAAETNMAPNR